MAAIDPKDLLIRNKVLVGAYVLAIVPIILWFVMIEGGIKEEYQKTQGQLRSKASAAKDMAQRLANPPEQDPVYTRTDVTRLQERRKLYEQELGQLADIVNGADAQLERWFDEFKATPEGKQPTTSDFVTRYNTNIGLLVERFKPIVTGPDGSTYVNNDVPTSELRRFQKRYWIQEALLEALAAAQKENPDAPIRLLAKLDFPAPSPPPPPLPGQEEVKPAAEMIPARLTVSCPFPRVPHLVRELLARPIPLRVTRLTVDKDQFTYDATRFPHYDTTRPRFSIDGREWVFDQNTYSATLPNPEAYGSQERWIPEPSVKVELVVEAYDFHKIEPPPPPPADGEGATEGGK